MLQTDVNKNSLKEIRDRERKEKEDQLRKACEELAITRLGSLDELKKLSNKHKGLWYLPALNEDESIDKMLILRPIDRHILSYASTKIADDGLYIFLEAAMSECVIKEHSDMEMIEDDDYFIPAANSFNKIIESRKTSLLKR